MQTLSTGQQRGVADFAKALVAATRNYSMYPPGHSIARKHLLHTFGLLTPLLVQQHELRLDVEETTLLHDGEPVYRGAVEESDLAFLLGRDGVRHLTFLRGITQGELQDLLTLINRYRIRDENQDGDIVTALWEEEFAHIHYEAVDILTLDGPAIDLSGFRVTPQRAGHATPGSPEGTADTAVDEAENSWTDDIGEEPVETESPAMSIALTARGHDLWALTLEERYELERMIAEEEARDNTADVMELLLITLVLLNDQDEFAATLDFLQDRVIRSLKVHSFLQALKVLKNLKNIRRSCSVKKRWALPLLQHFFTVMARPESLREVDQFLAELPENVNSRNLEALRTFLCMLPPTIIDQFGPLYSKLSGAAEELVFAVIKHHGKLAPDTLARALPGFPASLCTRLIPVAEWMKTVDGTAVFTRMALHPDRQLGRKAFDILVRRDTLDPVALFPLIDNPDPEIRRAVFTLLGKKRDQAVEELLLNFLEEHRKQLNDREQLEACYLTLGRCGSAHSVPLLGEVLLSKEWGSMLNLDQQAHRQGAARALAALGIPEALEILKTGAAGIRPDIRRACKKALGR